MKQPSWYLEKHKIKVWKKYHKTKKSLRQKIKELLW